MNDNDAWMTVPRKLTFGMRIALEEAIIRHDKDLDRVWREVLDFAPTPHAVRLLRRSVSETR